MKTLALAVPGAIFGAVMVLGVATAVSVRDPGVAFSAVATSPHTPQIVDRQGKPLSRTYQSSWNHDDRLSLRELPESLVAAFVHAEDRRFYAHRGVDWQARAAALLQNVRAGRVVRGASTITEQVVRMLHPRPRRLWSRWLEGWEAMQLERHVSKTAILEFYLNQVPYAANRRGVVQAARTYFGRHIATLDDLQMQALAVLVRAPSRFDPRRGSSRALLARVEALRASLGQPSPADWDLQLAEPQPLVEAGHFIRTLRGRLVDGDGVRAIRSTLDGGLQQAVNGLLRRRLDTLSAYDVANGAVLVADHQTREVLAWSVAAAAGSHIDAVTSRRQPGSALKPFLYALALERGWQADTLIDDLPERTPVGDGLHTFRNYSGDHHGAVTLRQALGSSLNIPAVRTAEHVGVGALLQRLRAAGLASLELEAEHYGVGLALGAGEVTLEELVGAYGALANGGVYAPLRLTRERPGQSVRVFTPEAASLIADVLADRQARSLEFGADNVLALPRRTAVKTGTSTDHRDAWCLAFDDRYVVGAWFGNLDRRPTRGLSGARGPALLVRSVLAELNRHRQPQPLWLSPRLAWVDGEYRLPAPRADSAPAVTSQPSPTLVKPSAGLLMAVDPRLPLQAQAVEFLAEDVPQDGEVIWRVDEVVLPERGSRVLWSLARGNHRLLAAVRYADGRLQNFADVHFEVR